MSKVTSLVCIALLSLVTDVRGQSDVRGQPDARIRRTVVYEGEVFEVGRGIQESKDLWVTLKDLTRVTKFVLKPQGMCRDKLCFPIPKARTKEFMFDSKVPKPTTWFNLSEFARLIHQPVIYDEGMSTWYFGVRSEDQNGYISSLQAPDFSLPDWKFQPHKLSDFRGKKVLLITWASW